LIFEYGRLVPSHGEDLGKLREMAVRRSAGEARAIYWLLLTTDS